MKPPIDRRLALTRKWFSFGAHRVTGPLTSRRNRTVSTNDPALGEHGRKIAALLDFCSARQAALREN